LFKTKKFVRPGTVAHTYKPSTWEAEAGGPWVPGQPGLHNKILSQKNLKKFLRDYGFGSVAKCLPGIYEALSLTPPHTKSCQTKYRRLKLIAGMYKNICTYLSS
jgi:hypothetical protein